MNSVKSQKWMQSSRHVWMLGAVAGLAMSWSTLASGCGPAASNPEPADGGSGGEGGIASGGGGGNGGAGGNVVEMPGIPEFVVKFDTAMGELGEGLAIDGTTAYVSFGSTKIIKVDLETGMRADFGSIPGPLGVAYPQGLVLDGQKNLYVAVHSADPPTFKPGIYKIAAGGGEGTLFAQHIDMSYPRHMHWVDGTKALVSDPSSGTVLELSNDGSVVPYAAGQAFGGDSTTGCAWGEGIAYGVTSVAEDSGVLFFTNGDKGTIHFGNNMLIAGPDCATLGGAEGLLIDPYDKGVTGLEVTFFVAARRANKIARVRYLDQGELTVVSDSPDLHEPSALAMAILGGDRYLIILNSARTTFNTGGVPGLLKMRLGKAN